MMALMMQVSYSQSILLTLPLMMALMMQVSYSLSIEEINLGLQEEETEEHLCVGTVPAAAAAAAAAPDGVAAAADRDYVLESQVSGWGCMCWSARWVWGGVCCFCWQ